MKRMNRSTIGIGLSLLVIVILVAAAGCRRGMYRRKADQQVYDLLGRANSQTRTPLEPFNIWPDEASRMHDPNDLDFPPMPPDDPASHKLMHCVDHKKGYPFWGKYGKTPYVENPRWTSFLCYDEDGKVLLNRRQAFLLARMQSREYQEELEDLYLSALEVTFQRFRLDAQFFGGNETFFTTDGGARTGGLGSVLKVDNKLERKKLFTTGAELAVNIANSFVWQFAGPDDYATNTLLSFTLLQPLLQKAGRAVVMEDLTESERHLLANIRQMERFRRSFYIDIIAGRDSGTGPNPSNLILSAFSFPTTGQTGGMLRLMEEQVQIRNQRNNVLELEQSLKRLIEYNKAGRVDRFQVDFARNALYNAQNRLLTLRTAYQDQLDIYKLALGVPPQLDIVIEDPLLDRFDLIHPSTRQSQETVKQLLDYLRDPEPEVPLEEAQARADLTLVLRQTRDVRQILEKDMQRLTQALPRRRASLRRLMSRPEISNGDVSKAVVDLKELRDDADPTAPPDEKDSRVEALRKEEHTTLNNLDAVVNELTAIEQNKDVLPLNETVERLTRLLEVLMELSVLQAGARLDTITLVPIELDSGRAIEVARRLRRDWKNARAALVDEWRQVEIAANDLQSGVDVTVSGDINTLGNNPVRFRGTTGRLKAGVVIDAPLTRLEERNTYRAALINYQRARREFYAFEDRVAQNLRGILRTIRLRQLEFELQRASVRSAIDQVAVTQIKLQEPPKPGETSKLGPTAARDLVSALGVLLNAQNGLVNQWTNYELQRMALDLDLGTMELDECGLWIDPGPIRAGSMSADILADEAQPEELPLPPGVPLEELLLEAPLPPGDLEE